jgi:hypothetical protein
LSDRSVLLREIDGLPLAFVKEVIDFAGFLKRKNGEDSGMNNEQLAMSTGRGTHAGGGEAQPANGTVATESGDDRELCMRELDSVPVAFVREVIDFAAFLRQRQTP